MLKFDTLVDWMNTWGFIFPPWRSQNGLIMLKVDPLKNLMNIKVFFSLNLPFWDLRTLLRQNRAKSLQALALASFSGKLTRKTKAEPSAISTLLFKTRM